MISLTPCRQIPSVASCFSLSAFAKWLPSKMTSQGTLLRRTNQTWECFPIDCSILRPDRFSRWNSKFSPLSMVVWQILCRIVRRYLSIWTEAGCSVNPDMIFQWGWSDLLKSKSTGDFEILIYMMQKSPLSAQNDV